MSRTVERQTPDRPKYHHGDLRHHLLRVAHDEIAGHGAQSVSLASLARLAGVSQAAPYRHFADRNALLEAVAAQAFDGFTLTLETAVAGRAPRDAMREIALAYLAFGQANMEVYRLMFASRLTPEADAQGDLNRASAAAFALLRTAVTAISPRDRVDDNAYRIWGQLHGLVMLKADGFITSALERFADGPFDCEPKETTTARPRSPDIGVPFT